MVNEEATGKVTNEGTEAGAEPTEALQIRRERGDLDAVPGDAGVDGDVSDGE